MIDTIPDNFVYFSLTLIDKDIERLMKVANNVAPKQMAKATKIYLEHVTLFHRNDKHQIRFKEMMYNILEFIFQNCAGETYEVTITDIGFNQKAIAFKVELPDGFPTFLHKTYHITIATFGNNKPVESNNIINWHKLFEPIIVTTILTKTIHENV